MKYLLSVDCGLTKSKLCVFDTLGIKHYEKQCNTPKKGFEIDVVNLHNTIVFLFKSLIRETNIKSEEIISISTSGHGNGLYLIGENGILPYAYSSMFTESDMYTPETKRIFPFTIQTSWSGQPLPILAYLKNEKNDVFGKIKKILFCKDVVKYILTGRICTDFTDASAAGLLNHKTSNYDKELLEVYGLGDSMGLLPDLVSCTDIIGTVSDEFSSIIGLTGRIPVTGGLFDVNSCILGCGVTEADRYCIISGTWGISSAISPNPVINDRITQCCNFCYKDRYMCIDSAPTSCVNLEWFLNNIVKGISYSEADEIVKSQRYDSELLYLPYIYKPMDMNVRGSFLGLGAEHTYRDMLKAVFEGIVFEHTYRLEKIKNSGIVRNGAVLTGGAANSEVLCQMFADCMGIDIYVTEQSQSGALGGAIIGATAVGIYSSLKEATDKMVRIKKCYHPDNTSLLPQKFIYFKDIIKIFKGEWL